MLTTVDYRSLSDIVCSVNRLQRLSLYIPRLIYVYSLRLLGSLLIIHTMRDVRSSLINSDSTVGSSSRYLHIGIFTKQ